MTCFVFQNLRVLFYILNSFLFSVFCFSVIVCVHGSYKRNLELILESSLKRMNRLHVHFSWGLPMDEKVISGMIFKEISM